MIDPLSYLLYSLEMLDRTEAPQVQDGYGISVAFACLIEVVRSIALTVGGLEYLRDQDYEPSGIYLFFIINVFSIYIYMLRIYLDFEIRNNERNTSTNLQKDMSPNENDPTIDINFLNIDNKKVEEDEKQQALQLQVTSYI